MQRRDFINLGLAGMGASFVAPKLALAKNGQNNMVGGVKKLLAICQILK